MCDFIDYHDDMYTEFAPEPIMITCDYEGTEVPLMFTPDRELFELCGPSFEGDSPEPYVMHFCPRHAAYMIADQEEDGTSTFTESTLTLLVG